MCCQHLTLGSAWRRRWFFADSVSPHRFSRNCVSLLIPVQDFVEEVLNQVYCGISTKFDYFDNLSWSSLAGCKGPGWMSVTPKPSRSLWSSCKGHKKMSPERSRPSKPPVLNFIAETKHFYTFTSVWECQHPSWINKEGKWGPCLNFSDTLLWFWSWASFNLLTVTLLIGLVLILHCSSLLNSPHSYSHCFLHLSS